MDPKMVEVLGNLGLRFLDQVMKQQAASGGCPQQQFPMQPPPGFGAGWGSPGPFWNPAMPPVCNQLGFYPMFDPSGSYAPPVIGWNGNPYG